MSLPKLNILIPTLQRPDTLYWTLKTVLEQDYTNFSVLVSDNYSNDDTPKVVASFKDSRVRYIKTDRKLSMSHHWEFALAHITDGYVTILGDDDGIVPGGLSKVAAIIQKHNPKAVGWRFGNFNWKGLPPHFMIPMGSTYKIVDSKKEVQKIFQKSIYTTIQFPSLYGGFIQKELIDLLKEKYGGHFFHSRIPDFFSGAIVAANIHQYIRIDHPITINATSKHSTGFATVSNTKSQNAFEDLRKNDDSNIPFYPSLVFVRSNAIPIAEAMLQVKKLEPDFATVNLEQVLQQAMNEAAASDNETKYNEIVAGVKEMGRMNGLEIFTSSLVKNHPYKYSQHSILNKYSPVTNTLYLDTSNSDISTVYDACKVASIFIATTLHLSHDGAQSIISIIKGYCNFLKGKSSEAFKKFF